VKRIGPDRRWDAADEVLSRLLGGEAGRSGLENTLLEALQQGYPLQKLRILLRSQDAKAAAAGMWIASELGAGVKPLLDDVVTLMGHPAVRVRFYSLDCVLMSAGAADEQAINLGLDLIDDPELAVRWKAIVFAATLSDSALRTALAARVARNAARTHGDMLLSLLDLAASFDSIAIASELTHKEPFVRRFAAAMAARIAQRDPGPLKLGLESADPTIRRFAENMLARLDPTSPRI